MKGEGTRMTSHIVCIVSTILCQAAMDLLANQIRVYNTPLPQTRLSSVDKCSLKPLLQIELSMNVTGVS